MEEKIEEMRKQSEQLCIQIKEQFEKLGISRFVVGDPYEEYEEELEKGNANVVFKDNEYFNDMRGDFNADSRLFYITGEDIDRYAFVFGISLENDELRFHIVRGSGNDNGDELDDDTEMMSLDEIFSNFRNFQEFNTIYMLELYLNLLQGKLYGDPVEFEVV